MGVGALDAGVGIPSGAIEYTMIRAKDSGYMSDNGLRALKEEGQTYSPLRFGQAPNLAGNITVSRWAGGERAAIGKGNFHRVDAFAHQETPLMLSEYTNVLVYSRPGGGRIEVVLRPLRPAFALRFCIVRQLSCLARITDIGSDMHFYKA